jgi:hypothetical protein
MEKHTRIYYYFISGHKLLYEDQSCHSLKYCPRMCAKSSPRTLGLVSTLKKLFHKFN